MADGVFPYQPLEFFNWLKNYLIQHGISCTQIVPHINGDLIFYLKTAKGDGNIISKSDRHFCFEGINKTVAQTAESILISLEKQYAPPFLTVTNFEKQIISFVPDVLKDCLISKLEVNRTQWGQFRLTSLSCTEKDCLELRFESRDGSLTATFYPLKVEVDESGTRFCNFTNMGVGVSGDFRNEEQRKLLSFQIENFVGFAVRRSFHPHQKFIFSNSEKSSLQIQGDGRDSKRDSIENYRITRLESFIKKWNSEERWRKFFYPESLYVEDYAKWDKKDVMVTHQSLECVFNMPHGLLPEQHLFLYNKDVQRSRTGEGEKYFFISTDLCEADVVGSGSLTKLEKALEQAGNIPDVNSIIVTTGCLAEIMGDSPLPFMKRIGKRKSSCIHWFGKVIHGPDLMSRIIKQRFDKSRKSINKFNPSGVALIYPGNENEEAEIGQMISLLGGKVLGSVVPQIGFSSFGRVKTASKFVPVYSYFNSLFLDEIRKDRKISVVDAAAPFGLSGTKKWLCSVAEVFNKRDKADDIFSMIIEPVKDDLKILKDRAGSLAAGFIADRNDLLSLNRSSIFFGFDIFGMLLEMGFCINIIAFGRENEIQQALEKGALKGRQENELKVFFFHDEKSLHKTLKSCPCRIVFSNINADPRASAAGKGVFSEVFFEVGIHGLIRTYKRLLKLIEKIPLRNYINT